MKSFTLSAIATAVVLVAASHAQAQTTMEKIELSYNNTSFTKMGVYGAWARGYTGKGSKIGFVDTGAMLKHADLSNVVKSYNPFGATVTDATNGHGTAMISLATGAKNASGIVGVAYNASAMIYQADNGTGLQISAVDKGIRWNADNGADVVNLSLGFSMSKSLFSSVYKQTSATSGVYVASTNLNSYSNTQLLSSLQYATGKGTIAVMSAGNDGNAVPASPANSAVLTDANGNLLLGGRAVIVGAVTANNVIASFSNQAGHICQRVVSGNCTDKIQIKDYFLVADGGSTMYQAYSNPTSTTAITGGSGTSQAAALVSGGIGVIKQAWPTLKPEQIVQVLLKTATDLGAPGVDAVYGNGLMNLDAATRPLGTVALAKITSVSSTQIAAGPTPLATTSLTSGVISKQSFENSTVMRSTQVVDQMGRNFTVNMAGGVNNTMQNYSTATSYSMLSNGKINRLDVGTDSFVNAMFNSPNMSGLVVGKKVGANYFGVETGVASEQRAMLGSVGSGAMSLGNSRTNWVSFHAEHDIKDSTTSVFGSVAHGRTLASGASDGLITSFTPVVTRSVTFGAKQAGVFDEKDSLSFQVTMLPYIVSGNANVTAVTGYTNSNVTEEGATATANVSSESVKLAGNYRQYATTLGYARNLTKMSKLNLMLTLQNDNAGANIRPTASVAYTMQF